MAHQIEQMAYVGAAPWHGLGNNLSPKQPLEVWQREAGMDWQIQESPVRFMADTIGSLGTIHTFPEQKVLFRSDMVFDRGAVRRMPFWLPSVMCPRAEKWWWMLIWRSSSTGSTMTF